MFELNGRTGIVTGASSGIGYAAANVLAQAGAKVYAVSRSGKVKDSSASVAPGVIHLAGDVCDYARMEELVQEIGNKDGIDFLINNAGITVKRRAEEFLDEDFERIHKVNVNSVFKLSCLCYPYLTKSPHVGRIINITSMAAHLGFSEVVPYCSSKGAVLAMTRGLAVEWANDNITVNSIAPGWFPSEMSVQVMTPERRQKILGRMPLHRFGDPNDLGAMAQFLLSDSAAYINGQDFSVDGGALAFGF
ncbi:SDR family NAD(P)-dependent oxidoreductase [Marasmitruncus massiliensis]|jgi:NAD(P)-dependent dehydrogenase (short-subunit alcohol dehydrogenase family)|uniref:SDR family NAD(P)-dependent oxidoreductase n=1 Tax=Marasmitruncus massiliensis TaxID=1944642 RepID=UPI000C79CEA1|nr:SDR family oxidoreductase [Marasmitruncus massiliensis]MBE6907869.1 SDR family oxidoreductase [Oscillospiraceae bacterium]